MCACYIDVSTHDFVYLRALQLCIELQIFMFYKLHDEIEEVFAEEMSYVKFVNTYTSALARL